MNETNEILIDDIKIKIYEFYTEIKSSLSSSEKEKLSKDTNLEITPNSKLSLIIKHLKNYIKFLIEYKNNNSIDNIKINNDFYRQLESYIIKLESDIKYLVKKQYQNKIQKDSLEMKIRAYAQIEEEYEELKTKVKYEDGKFLENDRKDNEIIILRRENSNLKKEIIKLEEEINDLEKIKFKNEELEKKNKDYEEIIKGFKNKIKELNHKIKELEEELINTKNNFTNNNEYNEYLININDKNSRNKIDNNNIGTRKLSLEKYSINNKNNILKHGITNYKLLSHLYNYESTKNNHNNSVKTVDTNKFTVSTYNKINNHKKIIIPLKNDFYINTKKIKNNSISMREEKENPESISKYISNSNIHNKFIKHIKSNSLNKIGKNGAGYKLSTNNITIRKYLQREKNNPYEHSALNLLGINKKI